MSTRKIYVLINPKGEMIKVGFLLDDVTNHLIPGMPDKIWNIIFESGDSWKRKTALESIGFKIERGNFIAEN